MREVEDEPLSAERVAGIDIARAGSEVTIWVPGDTRAGRRQQETRSFATTRRALGGLAGWLGSWLNLPGRLVPPEPIRALRTHTRCRRHLTQARTAGKARVEKLLEDAHLKLSSVISDIHGDSGRAMPGAVTAGQRNPRALAQLGHTDLPAGYAGSIPVAPLQPIQPGQADAR